MSTSVSTPHPRRTGRLAGAQSASVPQREGGPGLGHRQADRRWRCPPDPPISRWWARPRANISLSHTRQEPRSASPPRRWARRLRWTWWWA